MMKLQYKQKIKRGQGVWGELRVTSWLVTGYGLRSYGLRVNWLRVEELRVTS